MIPMEFSGFIGHSYLCIFQCGRTVRKVDQPRGDLGTWLETSVRYLKFSGASVDSNWT